MSPMKIPNFLIDRDIIPGYNHIINGNFDVWQRALSQTTSGYGSDDMWNNYHAGTTKTHSLQNFGPGELFPDGVPCPRYYSRTIVNSVVGVNNYCLKYQKLENLHSLADKDYILTFYAKANSTKKLSVEIFRNYGLGGTVSPDVYGEIVQQFELTPTWKKYKMKIHVDSIVGKLIGTANNDGLLIVFWFDGGSSFDFRTDNLGHQSGTFDLAKIALMRGSVDSPTIFRSKQEELMICRQYYEEFHINFFRASDTAYYGGCRIIRQFTAEKRRIPVINRYYDYTKTNTTTFNSNRGDLPMTALTVPYADQRSVYFHNANTHLIAAGDYGSIYITADASL